MMESTYLPREAKARLAHFDKMLFAPKERYVTLSDLQVLWRTMFPEPLKTTGRGLGVRNSVIHLRLDSHRTSLDLYGFETVRRLTKAGEASIRGTISISKTTPRPLVMFWPTDLLLPESCFNLIPRFFLSQTTEPVLEPIPWREQASHVLEAIGCDEPTRVAWLKAAAARKLK